MLLPVISLTWAVAILLTNSVTLALECGSKDTLLESRWLYNTEDITCAELIARSVDFYNVDYRKECKFSMNLPKVPERTNQNSVFECHKLKNGNLKYYAQICCEGVAPQSCYSCDNVLAKNEKNSAYFRSPGCNWKSNKVETCSAGQVCITEIKYGTYKNRKRTVTKGCYSNSECKRLRAKGTCKNSVEPACYYCCSGALCNVHIDIKNLRPTPPNPCDNNRCRNGATCSVDPNNGNKYVCTCTAKWKGRICSRSIFCHPDPCANEGECRVKDGSGFVCECRVSYWGKTCKNRYGFCAVNTCKNGGTCYDHKTYGERCDCPAGFVGETCEIRETICGDGIDQILVTGIRKQVYGSANYFDCDDLDQSVKSQTSTFSYVKTCMKRLRSRYGKNGRYRVGIDGGPIPRVLGLSTATCDHGDNYLFTDIKVCCPACLSSPCQNGGKCYGTDYGYKCNCKSGWAGKNCDKSVKICYGTGDPHYMTFDGELIHYQGVCKLDLASPVGTAAELTGQGLEYFRVLTKNQHRHGNTHVSYLQYVELHVYGHVIRVDRNKYVTVDDVQVFPHYNGGNFEISADGGFVTIITDFGLEVKSDGGDFSQVTLPDEYQGLMGGICADANDRKENDFRLKDGTDVTSDPKRDSKIGNSWKVPDLENPGCFDPETTPPLGCSAEEKIAARENSNCGTIADRNAVFKECIARSLTNSVAFYDNCEYDFCANRGNAVAAKKITCAAAKAYATYCEGLDLKVDGWKLEADCPDCLSSELYKDTALAECIPTCDNPVIAKSCYRDDSETCRCSNPSDVMIGGKCSSLAECACVDPFGRTTRPGDAEYLSADCTTLYTCEKCMAPECSERDIVRLTSTPADLCNNCKADPTTNVGTCAADPCEATPCGTHGVCSATTDDTFVCLCNDGYSGDTCDKDVCTPNPCVRGTCSIHEGEFVCECDRGYHGDRCDKDVCTPKPCGRHGTCTVQSDTPVCDCTDGYTGDRCEKDPCSPNPCDHGVCSVESGNVVCDCDNGYKGDRCDIDICTPSPCGRHGTCSVVRGRARCTCTDGYSGDTCDKNPCSPNPCGTHGTCSVTAGGVVECACDAGYSGDKCSKDVCTPNPCGTHGTCSVLSGMPICDCDAGYTGDECETVIDLCDPNPCGRHGTCTVLSDMPICDCDAGYTGDKCETVIDLCDPNPCGRHGTCTVLSGMPICDCDAGYTGDKCETVIDLCDPNPCGRHGTCTVLSGMPICDCDAGYTGDKCETVIDLCDPNPCGRHGTCTVLSGMPICDCDAGYTGDKCETVIDLCDPNPCGRHGTCTVLSGMPICDCDAGYTGDKCETVTNVCDPNPCGRHGTCTVLSGNPICDCDAGYTGDKCETVVDACTPKPCGAHGTCTVRGGAARCSCEQGYSGDKCDKADKCTADFCGDHGTCVSFGDSVKCNCDDGYVGYKCARAPCLPNPCNNHGICTLHAGRAECTCEDGYGGDRCQTDTCDPNPCHHGVCTFKSGKMTCDCDSGYEGDICEIVKDRCTDPNLCPEGQQCVSSPPSDTFDCIPVGDGNWSPWSKYGSCDQPCGQAASEGHQKRFRTCSAPAPAPRGKPCSGPAEETRTCICQGDFNANVDCKRCKVTDGVGYLEDSCDCQKYYQCQKINDLQYIVYHKTCADCTVWDGDKLTCVLVDQCTTRAIKLTTTTQDYECPYTAVEGDRTKYIQDGKVRPCPKGTLYNAKDCGCTDLVPTTGEVSKVITCIGFDDGWNGFGGTNWGYFRDVNVNRVVDTRARGHSAQFSGKSRLEFNALNNAYLNYRSFAVSLWYKRARGTNNWQGIMDNGNCENNPSLMISSRPNFIKSLVVTDREVTATSNDATAYEWNHVVLSYDGETVVTYVNGVATINGALSGPLKNTQCGLIFGYSTRTGAQFVGLMDDICIYKSGLTSAEAAKIYRTGGI